MTPEDFEKWREEHNAQESTKRRLLASKADDAMAQLDGTEELWKRYHETALLEVFNTPTVQDTLIAHALGVTIDAYDPTKAYRGGN